MKLKQMIVDADICIKIGLSEKYLFVEKLFPCIAEKIYIHKVVFDEIKVPACAKQQLEHLIELGIVEMVSESNLSDVEQVLYHAIYDNLADVMVNKSKPNKNKGEISSLAMAKITNIPIFATDEKDLQPIINEKLNTGIFLAGFEK